MGTGKFPPHLPHTNSYHVRLKTYDLADAEIGRRGETASKGGFPSAGDCVSAALASLRASPEGGQGRNFYDK